MSHSALAQHKNLSHEEYFALEEELNEKFEYIAGEVFAMSGGSVFHALIGANSIITLGNAFRHHPCRVLSSDAKLQVTETDSFLYPDAMVVCDENDDNQKYIQSPRIIIEVLSPSTEDYDHGKKFAYYRLVKSLQIYIMLHQDKPLAEVYQRNDDNSWTLKEYLGLKAVIKVPEDVQLTMTDLYHKVDFRSLETSKDKLERK